jgi:hypothetical protein
MKRILFSLALALAAQTGAVKAQDGFSWASELSDRAPTSQECRKIRALVSELHRRNVSDRAMAIEASLKVVGYCGPIDPDGAIDLYERTIALGDAEKVLDVWRAASVHGRDGAAARWLPVAGRFVWFRAEQPLRRALVRIPATIQREADAIAADLAGDDPERILLRIEAVFASPSIVEAADAALVFRAAEALRRLFRVESTYWIGRWAARADVIALHGQSTSGLEDAAYRYFNSAHCDFAPAARDLALHYLAGLPMREAHVSPRDVAQTLGRFVRQFGLFGDLLAEVEARRGASTFADEVEFSSFARMAASHCVFPMDRARRNPGAAAPP